LNLVVDANVLISALVKNSHTRHFLLLSPHSFYVPEFVFEEINEHADEISRKSGLPANNVKALLEQLISAANVRIIPLNEFKQFREEAEKNSPDPDDAPYFALALKLGCPLWSNDARLKNQSKVKVFSTKELFALLR